MWDGSAGGINENRRPNFLKGLHHVEIYVSNLARSTEFWGWFLTELGYVPFQEWDAGRSWRLNDTYLVFVQALDRHADVTTGAGWA